jgi:hypothetical protein
MLPYNPYVSAYMLSLFFFGPHVNGYILRQHLLLSLFRGGS